MPTVRLRKASEYPEATQKLWFVWVGLLVVFVLLLLWLHKTEKGRLIRDKVFLRVPLIKQIVLYAVVERVCRIVAAMVKAGTALRKLID